MLLEIECCVSQKKLPRDYHPTIVSLIKHVISEKYNDYYKLWYESGAKQKQFTFSVVFSKPKFNTYYISFESEKIIISFSSSSEEELLVLYNSFAKNIGYEHPLQENGVMKVVSANFIKSPTVSTNMVRIKLLSPLVVRNHIKGEKDKYYIYSDEQFEKSLNIISSKQYGQSVSIQLLPEHPKYTVVRSFNNNIRCSIGTYILKATSEQINYFLKSGLGSRRNEGFGMFTVVGGENCG